MVNSARGGSAKGSLSYTRGELTLAPLSLQTEKESPENLEFYI